MNIFQKTKTGLIRIFTRIFLKHDHQLETHTIENFSALSLARKVKIQLILPPNYYSLPQKRFPLLLFNDGQDFEALNMLQTLEKLYETDQIHPLIVVGIHAGNRLQEYGTAHQADYQNRGSRANLYTQFILQELLPFLELRYRCTQNQADYGFAGFSLGGLSAFDIVWNHPDRFSKVGVFSGSLWWRSQPFKPEDPDANRIIHQMVKTGSHKPALKFWFEAGTNDENEDRNNNGIIDAIDDTIDLMDELEILGYSRKEDMFYLEVPGGIHHPSTWGDVMADFLMWGYKK